MTLEFIAHFMAVFAVGFVFFFAGVKVLTPVLNVINKVIWPATVTVVTLALFSFFVTGLATVVNHAQYYFV